MNTEKIEKLKKGLNSSHINDDLKAKIQAEINRLEKEDEKPTPTEKKPRAVRKPAVKKETPKAVEPKAPTKVKNTVLSKAKEIRKDGESWKDAQKRASEMLKKENQTDKELTKSEMKELLAMIDKNEKLKKLVGTTNIARDASRVSLPAGKRVSKEGNTYYENRINRTDRVRVGKLSLAKGGRVSRVWSEEQSEKVANLDADFEKEVEKQGINPNSKEASDLWSKGGFKDRMYEIFKDNKAEGGSIPNNYEGKTAEEIWDSWNKKQRQHFLADHADVMDIKDLIAYNKEFKDLQFLTQAQLELHIEQGQYAEGGYLTDPTFGQFQAQVYSDGGEVQVYKGFHGLQAENYIDNVDGFDWNIITMKRHTGNLVSSATAGQSKKGKDGIVEIFTHDWDAPKMNLVTSKPSRVTEKFIAEQHRNALEIFREKMAGKFEQGGNFDKPFNVIYKTKSGRGMVASNIMAKNEKEAEEKLKKQMSASSTFDSVIMVHKSFEKGGMLSSKERYALEIKGQTGLSVGAIEKYIDDNSLSDNDVLNIVVGLGRRQLKGANVATAVAGKKGNAESKKLISFMKDDKAMKMELGGNVGAYDLAGHLDGTLNVGQNNGNLDGFSGTQYSGLVGETGAMSSGEMFENGGNVGAYDLAGHLYGTLNVGQNNGNLDGFSGTQYSGLVGETGAMSSGEMFENGGGLDVAMQSYTNAYAHEGTGMYYENGGAVKGNLNKEVNALALKQKLTTKDLSVSEYNKMMTQALVESLTDANFHEEAKEVVMKAEGKKTWTKELYKSEYFNTDKKVGEFARSVTKICDYDGDDIINAYYFTTKMQGSKVGTMIENLFLDKAKSNSNKKETSETVDLGFHFEAVITKHYYTSGEFTYGAVLNYENELFKFFVGIPNTSKKEALENVRNYLKTLSVSEKIAEDAPRKGQYAVYYHDRGGEHRRISENKHEIQEFVKNVNYITKESKSSSKKQYDVVVKINDKLKTMKEFEDFSKEDVIEWCETRGWKYNQEGEKKGGNILKEYEFFIKEVGTNPIILPKSSSKKYIAHYDIASITVKKGSKQTTFKGSDVLNGANMLKKGGDLSKSATYFPKRDIVSVKLKSGEVINPANGYWVGKTPKMVRTQFEESAFEYKAGGVIKNQYEGKTAEKVWGQWNESQRSHFLLDHSELLDKDRMENNLGYSRIVQKNKEYSELTPHTKRVLESHIESGQYEEGGKVEEAVINKDGIKVKSVAMPEKKLTEAEWMLKHSESNEARAYKAGGSLTKYSEFVQGEFSRAKREANKYAKKHNLVYLVLVESENSDSVTIISAERFYSFPKSYQDAHDVLYATPMKMNEGGKVSFKEKATAIAKNFEGKRVEPKYQNEYGKTYNKAEAKEVGNKIAGSQKAMYDSKMSTGGAVKKRTGSPKMKEAHVIAKRIRKEGESWSSALKRAWAELK